MSLKNLSRKPKRIMACDLSTQSIAYSIWDQGDLVEWGEIDLGKGDLWQRLNKGSALLKAMANRYKVQKVVFESAVYIQNKKTVILLAYAYGALIAPLAKKGVEVEETVPTAWQNFIGNKALTKLEKDKIVKAHKGKSQSWYKNAYREFRKERTKEWVAKNTGVVVHSDNVADAIAIGWVASTKGTL